MSMRAALQSPVPRSIMMPLKKQAIAMTRRTLDDSDIVTMRRPGRRRVLGLLAGGGAALGAGALGVRRASAQGADADNGTWTDAGNCPRGTGGVYTGVTDSDNGALTDRGGYGRGEPYC